MSDEEIICAWMAGPKPTTEPEDALDLDLAGSPLTVGGWWECRCCYTDGDVPRWYPRNLTLDVLRKVEEKLTWTKDVSRYDTELRNVAPGPGWTWHVTAEQKIRALAAVLRLMEIPNA